MFERFFYLFQRALRGWAMLVQIDVDFHSWHTFTSPNHHTLSERSFHEQTPQSPIMKIIRRWRFLRDGDPPKDRPFVADFRTVDIPNTMVNAISNVPPNCVAITWRITHLYGPSCVAVCERAARRKGIRLLWVRIRAGMHRVAPSALSPDQKDTETCAR